MRGAGDPIRCPALEPDRLGPGVTADSEPLVTEVAPGRNGGVEVEGATAEKLFPLVYDELRRLAKGYMSRETPGHTLQPTALVHEAYLRFARNGGAPFRDRAHFRAWSIRSR